MKKIKLICTAFVFLFVCCLFSKPVSAETAATDRQGYRVYTGGSTNCIGYLDTKTGKVKTVFNNDSAGWYDGIENLCYYKGYFYIDSENEDFFRVSKSGKISKSFGKGEGITVYKNKIYYTYHNSIRRCSLNGKKKKVVVKMTGSQKLLYFTVMKGRLYYVVESDRDTSIYSASLAGGSKRRVCCIRSGDDEEWTWEDDNSFYRSGNTIYFFVDAETNQKKGIYKYTAGAKSITQVCSLGEIDGRIVGVKNNQLYFTRSANWDEAYFCRVPVSGGTYKTIKKTGSYYVKMGKGNYCLFYKNDKWYSMKLNGTGVKRVRPRFF